MLICGLFTSLSSYARCTRVTSINAGADGRGASSGLGNINITSNYLQPVGSPLGSSIVSFSNSYSYPNPEAVLYECDITDKDSIYEVFATNGDDRVGGYWDIGAADGYPNYFATYFPYVAIKLTHLNSGKDFIRNWQEYPIQSYNTVGNKIQIRVKDFSQIRADAIKVSSLPGAKFSYCGSNTMAPTTGKSSYTCTQPNGYVHFKGPGISGETAGTDSNDHYGTWGTGRWMVIGMGTPPIASLSHTATCVVRNHTPLVILPTISVTELNAGKVSSSTFDINIECDNTMQSGIQTDNTSLGLQTTVEAFQKAQQLNLVNSQGGVSYLLSDGYGVNPSIATGVGIELSNTSTGAVMPFVGWSGCSTNTPCSAATSSASGWFPVLAGSSSVGSSASGYTNYLIQLTASLKKLPTEKVVSGAVDAKAYIIIKVQ